MGDDSETTGTQQLTRRTALKIAGAAGVGAVLSSCFPGGTPSQPAAAPSVILPPETLTIAQGTDALHITPYGPGTSIPNFTTTTQIFEGLVHYKKPPAYPDFDTILAERWETPNPTTWRFYLRKGVKFHNGKDFDSDSVAFSLDHIRQFPDSASGVQPIDKIVPVDKYTVDIITKQPWFILLSRLNSSMPMEDRTWSTSADYSPDRGVGTGPYKLVEWAKGDHITMERNEDWWGPKPPFKRVIWRSIPEFSTRTSALLAGEVDLIRDLQPQDVSRVQAKDGLVVKTVASDGVQYFKMRDDGIYASKSFRQALNYAVDKEAIRKGVMGGFGVNTNGHRDPNMLGVDKSLGEIPYDVDKAKQLIKDSGYQGQKVVIEGSKGIAFKDAEVAQAVGGYFEKAGLTVEVKILEAGAYNAKKSTVDIEGLILTSSGNIVHDFENVLDDLMVRGGTAVQFWKNPRAVQIRTALQQTVDVNERIRLAQEGARLVKDECPILVVAQFVTAYGLKTFVDWEPRPDQHIWVREMKFKG